MTVPEINEVEVTEVGVSVLLPRIRSIQVESTKGGKLLTVTDTAFAAPVRFHLTNDAADHLSRLLISNPSEPAHA